MAEKANEAVIITEQYLLTHCPELLLKIQQETAAAECARIQAVEAQGLPGHEDLIQTLKFDGQTTGDEAAKQVLAAERAYRGAELANFHTHTMTPLSIGFNITDVPNFEAEQRQVLTLEEQCQVDWERDSRLREEFLGEFDAYRALMRAEARKKEAV